MSATTTCLWCGAALNAERASKKVCSDACRMAFKRWTNKLHIQNTTGFIYVEAIKLFGGRHPNPNYKENNEQSMPILQ